MDISGFVVLGIVTLFLVYLMPQLIRSRQDVVDSRVDDRFSAELRILATASASGPGARFGPTDDAPRAYLHRPSPWTEVSAMNRPLALVSRPGTTPSAGGSTGPEPGLEANVGAPAARDTSRDAARGAAARAAAGRRRAAARRRLLLTLVLAALAVGTWSAVALGVAPVAVAVAPTLLLAVVLVLGRRAAVADTRRRAAANAAWPPAAVARATDARPAVPVRAAVAGRPAERLDERSARPTREMSTEILPRAIAGGTASTGLTWRGEPTAPAVEEVEDGVHALTTSHADGAGDRRADAEPIAAPGTWTPVPVPVPTYTMKPIAPRMDAAPIVLDQAAPGQDPVPAVDLVSGPDQYGSVEAQGAHPTSSAAPQPEVASRSIDLDAVLSRRRASGE